MEFIWPIRELFSFKETTNEQLKYIIEIKRFKLKEEN